MSFSLPGYCREISEEEYSAAIMFETLKPAEWRVRDWLREKSGPCRNWVRGHRFIKKTQGMWPSEL